MFGVIGEMAKLLSSDIIAYRDFVLNCNRNI